MSRPISETVTEPSEVASSSNSAFSGFPRRSTMGRVSLPGEFFSSLLPEIRSIVELKVTLHLMWLLSRRAGMPRCIKYVDLVGDKDLAHSLKVEDGPRPAEDYLREGLELAVARGTVLHVLLVRGDEKESWLFLNTHGSREAIEGLQSEESTSLMGALAGRPIDRVVVYRPNVFALYEQNIGPLTPMIAELLREAERQYPQAWIEDAVRLAVVYNKRSWRYVETILQRWEVEGRSDALEAEVGDPTNPDSFFRTKYAHIYK